MGNLNSGISYLITTALFPFRKLFLEKIYIKAGILNHFFSYKLCVTEKRTYVNKLKFTNGFVVNLYPLINYLAQNAAVGNIEYDSDKPNSCNICQISFRKKMKHRAHITVFQDGKKYLGCCACDKKFGIGEYRYLKRHIALVHEGKKGTNVTFVMSNL